MHVGHGESSRVQPSCYISILHAAYFNDHTSIHVFLPIYGLQSSAILSVQSGNLEKFAVPAFLRSINSHSARSH